MTHSEGRFTGFIGFRLPNWLKLQLMQEAVERGESLSRYIYELIETGWDRMNKENVKQFDKENVKQ